MHAKITTRLVKDLIPKARLYTVRDTEVRGFSLRVSPTGNKVYYLDYRMPDGRRRSFRIGPAGNLTVAQARDQATKRAASVVTGVDVQAERQREREEAKNAKSRTWGGFLEHAYGPWVTTERKTGTETLRRLDHNFSAWRERALHAITPWIVEKWRAEQRKAGKAPTTINRDVVALKAALSKAVDWGFVDQHPLARLKPIKTDGNGKVRYLTLEEEAQLRAALAARDRHLRAARESGNRWRRERGYAQMPDLNDHAFADHLTPMVLLSLNTGLRQGEVFDLTWQNVDLERALVTVEGKTAKSATTRHVPLNAEAVAVLRAWHRQCAGSGLVFPGRKGGRIDNVNKSWKKVLGVAKVHEFRWHDLRHSFASKLVMRGVDLNTVRELLGHAQMTMTLRYAHLAPEHKAEAVARLLG